MLAHSLPNIYLCIPYVHLNNKKAKVLISMYFLSPQKICNQYIVLKGIKYFIKLYKMFNNLT